jgi:rhamnulokinase
VVGPIVAAVDFGASSIRVSVVDLDRRPLEPEVVHRYRHGPVRHPDGSLRWDWSTLVSEARRGLESARAHGPLASIGVDTWGLDYGLLDAAGDLVAPPHSYRDERLADWWTVAERLGPRHIYDIAGIQLMAGNGLFQLALHDRAELDRARHVLTLPELLLHELCGVVLAERTSAGTTSLVDLSTGTWSDELIAAIGADRSWFPDIRRAGERVGTHEGAPIHLVGGHDTASAVLAMGADPGPRAAFVSAGTLFLVGREWPEPRTDDACFERNLANEPGVYGGVRLLGNLPGMWLLEECRRAWRIGSVADLLADLGTGTATARRFDVTDESLVAPPDMPAAIAALAGIDPADRTAVVASTVESMADAVADAVERLDLGEPPDRLVVFGGAVAADGIVDRIGARCGLPIERGPAEATTLGNALAQGIALGVWRDATEARRALGR